MPNFKYQAMDSHGKEISGSLEAASPEQASAILGNKKLKIISISENEGFSLNNINFSFGRVKPKDLVIFSRQFSVLVAANVALVQSLKLLVDQTENPKLKSVVADIANEVDGGARLSDTFAKYPNIFSNFYINVVKSGETSGKLDEVLNYLADELEKDYDMMSKIKGAMIYPAFVLSALGGVGIVMMVFIVPKLTSMMTESGVELPITTKILIGVSAFLSTFWVYILIFLVGSAVGLKFAMKRPDVKHVMDVLLLKMPIFGNLFKRIYLVRFTRSLQTLIIGGVSISKALSITAEIVTNSVYKNLIEETKKEVEDGNSISSVFIKSPMIPNMVSQMMSIGEKTGRLDVILERITDFYGREIDNIIANLMSLMEPVIMVVMGIGVGIMVAAIMMPMYNMGSGMS
jgi:type IV pilus assembly protein PilC